MNYKRIHDSIISNALARDIHEGIKYERHHILPRCMGGGNEPDNIVKLLPREHVLIHILLYKIYKTGNLAYAVTAMRMNTKYSSRPNSKIIAEARIEAAKYFSENYSGVNHNWYGKKHSEDTKNKIRIKAIGRKKGPIGVEKTASSKRRRIIATDIKTGDEIEIEGMRKAAEMGYAKSHGSISHICRKGKGIHNGYSWRYAD